MTKWQHECIRTPGARGEKSPRLEDFAMRRSFPRSPLLTALLTSGVCSCTPVGDAPDMLADWSRVTASPARREPAVDPMHPRRNVIIVIGDGMQLAHEVATSRYLYGTDDGLSFHSLPTRLFKTTWDVNVYNSRASSLGVAKYTPD